MTPIAALHSQQRSFFSEGHTKPLAFRIAALKRLKTAIIAQEDAICHALYQDFKKPKFESLVTETQFILAELDYTLKNLKFWARKQSVPSSWTNFPSKDWVQYEPYGNTLIIGPWNYPFQLCIAPLIGAIAAGNTTVLKPSEHAPHTAAMVQKVVAEALEKAHVQVVEGGVETSQALLDLPWDYIFFTGSTRIGKIVYQKAAEHLTPVTLELGGKNACVVDHSAAINTAAKRIVWGKFLNAGQTCVAPDYILVHHSVKEALVTALKKAITKQFGAAPRQSSDLARIATAGHYERLKTLLKEQEIICGGDFNDSDRYLAPTLVNESKWDSPLMEDEIFGPILPIISYTKEAEIEPYLSRYSKPLAQYVFSSRKTFQKQLMENYAFGGGAINDTVIHLSNKHLPFGGIGASGIGAYHGKHSFVLFSHQKAIVKKPAWIDPPLRYPPYKLPEKWIKWLRHLF
ncbi:MAG: aldehyde dehydrogenase [Bacteroidota bacterium]